MASELEGKNSSKAVGRKARDRSEAVGCKAVSRISPLAPAGGAAPSSSGDRRETRWSKGGRAKALPPSASALHSSGNYIPGPQVVIALVAVLGIRPR